MIFRRKNHSKTKIRKRQWGAEKRTTPLSNIHDIPSIRKVAFSRIAIVLTIFFWLSYLLSIVIREFIEGPKSYDFTMEAFGYLFVMSVLTFSALMYLITRQGAFQRFSKHVRVPRSILDKHFSSQRSAITVLVPSYSEEPQVIRKTLLSAALQEYPKIRVVLLLDDNPNPTVKSKIEKLEATRELATELTRQFATPYNRFSQALAKFHKTHKKSGFVSGEVITNLRNEYQWAADWLTQMAAQEIIEDHVDIFFRDQVLLELANDFRLIQEALRVSVQDGVQLSTERIHQFYQRLVRVFGFEMEIFERKKYASLSHEANKAMNLNSYIGLMGGIYRKELTHDGIVLVPDKKAAKDTLTIPDSEFILTLDADSILLKDYCLRLVHYIQQPGNERIGVIQTPYSSFRGAYSRIERLSSATTDIQHILHQGMSHYGATFWVGANAVIRKQALLDIAQKEWVGGYEVKRFIQDRTVIEDTESSIDLALHGWKLVNYPERLSYSATPPDFGSLIVQRRRWANGGLLILPKLFSQIRARKNRQEMVSRTEIMIRLNYMASIAWASIGLVFLLAYPYDGRLLSPLVILSAMPYFVAMAIDLKYCGYNYSDVLRIYGFNLILLPVNLAGVLKSLEQAITAKKIPFARTPKIKNRTAAPLPYVVAPLLIVAFSLFTVWRNIVSQHYGNAAFAAFNAFAASWAIVAYIGIWNLIADLWFGLTNWMYVETKPKVDTKAVSTKQVIDWQSVLYHGEEDKVVPHHSLADLVVDTVKTKERLAV